MGIPVRQSSWERRVSAEAWWPKRQSRIVATALLAVGFLVQPEIASCGADSTREVHTPRTVDADNSTRRSLTESTHDIESDEHDTCDLVRPVTHRVQIVAFGRLGVNDGEPMSESVGESDLHEGMQVAEKWIFATIMRSMFFNAAREDSLGAMPKMEYFVVKAYEYNPQSDGDDQPSPYNRTIFSFTMSGDPPCFVRRRSIQLCSDYASPQQELLYALHRSLGMAGKFPREALKAIGDMSSADISSSLLLVSYLQYTDDSDPIESTGCNYKLNSGFGPRGAKGSRLQIPKCPAFAYTCRDIPELCEGDEEAKLWQCRCDYGYTATPAIHLQLHPLSWEGVCIPTEGYCSSQIENGRPLMLNEAEAALGVPLEVARPKCEDGTLGKPATCFRNTRERGAWLPAEDGCGEHDTEHDTDSDNEAKPCVFRSRKTRATSSQECVETKSPGDDEPMKLPHKFVIVKDTPQPISMESGGSSPHEDSAPPVRFKVVNARTAECIPGAVVDIFEDPEHAKVLGSVTITSQTVDVYTDLAIVYARASIEGYESASVTLDRRYECEELTSCMVQIALSPSIDEGEVFSDDCTLEVDPKNAANDLQMRVVLRWSSRVPDLDIWVRNVGCSEDMHRQAGLPDMEGGLEEVIDDSDFNEKLAPQMDETVSFAEAQACGMSIVYKYRNSGRSVFREGKPQCLKSKVPGLEGCRSREARSKNQFPKWLFWGVRYMDYLHKRLSGVCKEGCTTIEHQGGEGWDDNSFVALDVDARAGNGPETVTFNGPPPGTYQIVVEKYLKNDGFGDIRDASPVVDLYLGKNIHLTCKIDRTCITPNHTIWNVANVVVTNTGPVLDDSGEPTGKRKITLRVFDDDRVAPLVKLDLPTTETYNIQKTSFETSPQYNVYSDATLRQACVGMCEPAIGDTQSGKCLVRPRSIWAMDDE